MPQTLRAFEHALVRFWAKVAKSDGCWIWTAATAPRTGYGLFKAAGKNNYAHRIVWVITFGAIPAGLNVLHHCDNPPCVRPDHLFLGTHADNVNDKIAKGRQPLGEQVGTAKLDYRRATEIRARYAAGGVTMQELADTYGVTLGTIHPLIRGKTWGPLNA